MVKDATGAMARWRSRRGMLELDLYLVPFAEREFGRLSCTERVAYAELLRCDDWQILDWLQGRREPDTRLAAIVERVRAAAGGR